MIRRIAGITAPGLLGLLLVAATAHGAGKEGEPFSHFKAEDLYGNPVDTAKFVGKKALLVDFWSINCVSCLEEMPHLVALYDKYKGQGLEALGVNMDRAAKRVISFIEKKLPYKMTYPNVVDGKAEIMRLLGVQMLPTTILVDASGTIRMFHVGYKAGFEKELEEIIKQHLPAP